MTLVTCQNKSKAPSVECDMYGGVVLYASSSREGCKIVEAEIEKFSLLTIILAEERIIILKSHGVALSFCLNYLEN